MGQHDKENNIVLNSEDLAGVASELFPFVLIDHKLDVLAFNSNFNQLLGYSETELAGRKVTDFLLNGENLDLENQQQKIQLQKKNGQALWVLIHPRKLHPYKENSEILIFINEANESIKFEKQAQKIRDDIQREYRNQTFLFKQLCYDLDSQINSLEKYLSDAANFRSDNVKNILNEMNRSLKPMLNLHTDKKIDDNLLEKDLPQNRDESNSKAETPLLSIKTRVSNQNAAKVLIVDDVEDNIIALGVYFKKLNIPFMSATSGQEALKLVQENDFEIAIIDLHMPQMNGLELAKNIRHIETLNKSKRLDKEPLNNDIKRIHLAALTSQESEVERKNCFQAGFDIHFVKPMTKQQLIDYLTDLHFLPLSFDIAI